MHHWWCGLPVLCGTHGILLSPHIQKFFIAHQANLFPGKGNAYLYNQIQTKQGLGEKEVLVWH